MMRAWPHGDPRDVVRSIVSDAHYHLAAGAKGAPRSWFDVARDWLAGVLRALMHRLDRAFGARNPFEAAVGFALIGAAFAILAFASYTLVRLYARRPRDQPARGAAASFVPAAQTAAALRNAARAAAQARHYRVAAALLFLSAARALDEGGRIAYDPARTPGEYRRLVRDPAFDALASDAVVALFAAAEPRDELYERMSGSYDHFFDTPVR
jgi:hypothetical protein